MFACPNCKEKLKLVKSSHLRCINKSCHLPKKIFPIINKIPILIPFNLEDCILEDSYSENFINFGSRKRDSSKIKMKIKKTVKDLIYGKNIKTIKNYKYLADHLKKDSKILIIGGGTIGSGADYFFSICKKKAIKIDSIDVYFSQNITAIADAHYLPFENESYELVIIQAVLEHVINPNRVVEEIYRILANNAIVYAETPFMQCVHEGPYDFGQSDLITRLHEKGMTLTMEHNFWHTPPVDALFIHRKLGGLFLLAKRLSANVDMREAASTWLTA